MYAHTASRQFAWFVQYKTKEESHRMGLVEEGPPDAVAVASGEEPFGEVLPLHVLAALDKASELDAMLAGRGEEMQYVDQTALLCERETPLHVAARFASLDAMQVLLAHDANACALTRQEHMPIDELVCCAAIAQRELPAFMRKDDARRRLEGMRLLLRTAEDAVGYAFRCMPKVAKHGYAEGARLLLSEVPELITFRHPSAKITVFHHVLQHVSEAGAVITACLQALHEIPSTKARLRVLNRVSSGGESALCLLAAEESGLPWISALLNMGANPCKGFPLQWAARFGHGEIVDVLLAHGADVHQVDEEERSALHVAAPTTHVHVVEQLLNYGADAYLEDDRGLFPIQLAGDDGVRKLLSGAMREQLLLAFLLTSRRPSTPLFRASKSTMYDRNVFRIVKSFIAVD